MSPLVPLGDVQEMILGMVERLEPVELSLGEALGAVLLDAVVAPEPVPPFANTAMDGYALRAADTVGASPDAPVCLLVVDDLAAGRAPNVPVGTGEAIRIMTGAPMPDGADAVVMVERTRRDPDDEGDSVLVEVEASVGQHVRAPGGDWSAAAMTNFPDDHANLNAGPLPAPTAFGVWGLISGGAFKPKSFSNCSSFFAENLKLTT